jgi:predicted nucleic acid-binding protein
MSGRAFLDSNVVVYAFSLGDPRAAIANQLLEQGFTLSVQVLDEFAAVARRKLAMSWAETSASLAAIRALSLRVLPVSVEVHELGVALAEHYGYRIYDALIVAAALEAGCSVLYSEDMQDGQSLGDLRIENPFRSLQATV